MMIQATLTKPCGKILGTKSVPEDCLAVSYGGATFVRVGASNGVTPPSALYQMTNTFHFNDLD